MYALGINLEYDAPACLIGGPDPCVPDAAGRWFALVPVERVTACLDAAGIDYGDLDTVTFCNGVVWTATELRNLTVADCVLQLPWSMQSRLEAIGAHLAEAHGGWYVAEFSDTAILVVTPHGSITGWRRSSGGSAIPLIERAMIGRIEDPAGSVRSAALGAALHGWYCALGQPLPRPPVLRSHEAGVC